MERNTNQPQAQVEMTMAYGIKRIAISRVTIGPGGQREAVITIMLPND